MTISSPRRERWTPTSAKSKRASATKSRSETASIELAKAPAKPSSSATHVESSGRVEPPSSSCAKRRGQIESAPRVDEAVDVAQKRPAVREQLHRERDPLGALKVGVSGDLEISDLLSSRQQCPTQVEQRVRHLSDPSAGVEPQSCRHLIVATPPGVEPGASLAGDLGHTALDRGVDVLIAVKKDERPSGELVSHGCKRGDERFDVAGFKDGGASEPAHMRLRAVQVIGPELSVERETLGEGHHRRFRVGRHPPRPQRHGLEPASP